MKKIIKNLFVKLFNYIFKRNKKVTKKPLLTKKQKIRLQILAGIPVPKKIIEKYFDEKTANILAKYNKNLTIEKNKKEEDLDEEMAKKLPPQINNLKKFCN